MTGNLEAHSVGLGVRSLSQVCSSIRRRRTPITFHKENVGVAIATTTANTVTSTSTAKYSMTIIANALVTIAIF